MNDVTHSLYVPNSVSVQCAKYLLQLMVRELSNLPAALREEVAPSSFCSPRLMRTHPEVFHVSVRYQSCRVEGRLRTLCLSATRPSAFSKRMSSWTDR